jgi:hypothetical protein
MGKLEIKIGERKGKYHPDISWIGDEGRSLRSQYTGNYVILMSYPGSPIAEIRENGFPDIKFFSPERFVEALGYVGWEFHGDRYWGRSPLSKWIKGEFAKEQEKIPDDLQPYSLKGEEDLDKIVMNAERRMRIFEPDVDFSSTNHGNYLSQELYEAGWFWVLRMPDVSILETIWDGETLP